MTPFLFKWSEVLHIYCKCKCCYFDKNIITGYIRRWQKWQLLTQSITKISSELRYFHFSIVQTQTPPIWPMYSHTRNSFPTNQQLYTQAHTREWHHITPHEICTVSLWFYHLSGWIHVVNSENCHDANFAVTLWRHQLETFSTLLDLCAGNSPVTSEFPSQRPVTWSFDVFFDLCLNKWLSKQSIRWWFEMPLHPLWCHSNEWHSSLLSWHNYLSMSGSL